MITMDIMKAKLRELQKQLVRPVTKENVFYHYLPLFGVKSYLELSINIFNPSLSSEIYKRLDYNFQTSLKWTFWELLVPNINIWQYWRGVFEKFKRKAS